MKKKYLIVTVMIFSCLFVACEKKEEVNNNEVLEDVEETVIEEEVYFPQVSKSKNEYDDIRVINDNYLLFEENGKYGVIDYSEEIIIQAEYDYSNDLSSVGMILLGNYLEQGYDCYLYDDKMNLLFSNDEYKEYTIAAINDNILNLVNYDKTKYKYLDMQNDYAEIISLDSTVIAGMQTATPYANGYVLIVSDTYVDEGFPNLMDKEGNIRYLKHNDEMLYTYFGCSIGEDGWILCYEVDLEDTSNSKKGFYNILNDTFILLPEELQYDYPIRAEDGLYHATYKNYALLNSSDRDGLYYIFDIENNIVVNDTPYSYVELNELGMDKILYSTENDKWGYLDSNLKSMEYIYDDATTFNDKGYALINMDGKEYLINSEFKIASEAFDGIEAIEDKGIFIITNEGKKYFIKID